VTPAWRFPKTRNSADSDISFGGELSLFSGQVSGNTPNEDEKPPAGLLEPAELYAQLCKQSPT